MQIINSFQRHSIYHLTSHLNNLHYLQRTYSNNLSSLLPLLLLQFFSITFVVGQNAAVTTATSARATTAQHPTNPIHSHTQTPHSSSSNTATTLHPTSSNTFSLPRNTNTLNNLHHHPTTLSTDDLNQQRLAAATTANHHRHHRVLGISPSSSDTLLNTVPIFPSDYDNLKPPKEDGGK